MQAYSSKSLAIAPTFCSSGVMHPVAAKSMNLTALSARSFVMAGNNNRANHNANHWRAGA